MAHSGKQFKAPSPDKSETQVGGRPCRIDTRQKFYFCLSLTPPPLNGDIMSCVRDSCIMCRGAYVKSPCNLLDFCFLLLYPLLCYPQCFTILYSTFSVILATSMALLTKKNRIILLTLSFLFDGDSKRRRRLTQYKSLPSLSF